MHRPAHRRAGAISTSQPSSVSSWPNASCWRASRPTSGGRQPAAAKSRVRDGRRSRTRRSGADMDPHPESWPGRQRSPQRPQKPYNPHPAVRGLPSTEALFIPVVMPSGRPRSGHDKRWAQPLPPGTRPAAARDPRRAHASAPGPHHGARSASQRRPRAWPPARPGDQDQAHRRPSRSDILRDWWPSLPQTRQRRTEQRCLDFDLRETALSACGLHADFCG